MYVRPSSSIPDITHSFIVLAGPVFGRPGHSPSPRSSTYTDSSGAETPPLSISDGSSQSSGSQSSIDIAKLNAILTNIAHPMAGHARNPIRARARGQGHRRRLSQVDPSRSSVYETIQEENVSAQNTPAPPRTLPPRTMLSPVRDDVVVVEADTESGYWNDDRGFLALRKYFALRDEAHVTVEESKRTWIDTPFSVYAVQCKWRLLFLRAILLNRHVTSLRTPCAHGRYSSYA